MKKARKAFFSFAIIAVVTAALVLFAAYSKSWYDYRNAQNYALEARLVDQRANDSQYFLSGLLDDIMVDAAYAEQGCGSGFTSLPMDICTQAQDMVTGYLDADANLSDPSTNRAVTFENTTAYDFKCGNSSWSYNPPSVPLEPYNYTLFIVNLTANYTVNTTNAAKHVDIVIRKLFALNTSNGLPLVPRKYFNATIDTPYGRNQSFYVDCT